VVQTARPPVAERFPGDGRPRWTTRAQNRILAPPRWWRRGKDEHSLVLPGGGKGSQEEHAAGQGDRGCPAVLRSEAGLHDSRGLELESGQKWSTMIVGHPAQQENCYLVSQEIDNTDGCKRQGKNDASETHQPTLLAICYRPEPNHAAAHSTVLMPTESWKNC